MRATETNVALNDTVSNNSVIQINRAIPVGVTINGVTNKYSTTKSLFQMFLLMLALRLPMMRSHQE